MFRSDGIDKTKQNFEEHNGKLTTEDRGLRTDD
jgi:hypothetical protein